MSTHYYEKFKKVALNGGLTELKFTHAQQILFENVLHKSYYHFFCMAYSSLVLDFRFLQISTLVNEIKTEKIMLLV